jgi:hypothetical protein
LIIFLDIYLFDVSLFDIFQQDRFDQRFQQLLTGTSFKNTRLEFNQHRMFFFYFSCVFWQEVLDLSLHIRLDRFLSF